MECFLGKSSPRPCKSFPELAGIQIRLPGGGGRGCASATPVSVEEFHRDAHVIAEAHAEH